MGLEQVLKQKRDEILKVCKEHGVRNVRVFGSAARSEAREDSDLDLLVEFESGRTLLDHSALVLDLEELLGRKVDIVTEGRLYLLALPAAHPQRGTRPVTKDLRVYLAHILESLARHPVPSRRDHGVNSAAMISIPRYRFSILRFSLGECRSMTARPIGTSIDVREAG